MKKFIITRLIFVFVFFEIALGITYFIICNNLPKEEIIISEVVEDNNNQDSKENSKTINLDDTYDLNDLQLTEYQTIIEGKNNVRTYSTDTYDFTTSYNQDLEIPYYQIDGLKDENIEISINYTLKNDIETKANEILDSEDYSSDMYVYCYEYSNFANTLSLYYSISYNNKSDSYVNITIPENFDLNTGKKINLSDVIINNSTTRQLISEKIYNSVMIESSEIGEEAESDGYYGLTIEKYNDVEEEIFELIYKFNNNKEINFVFNGKNIFLLDYNKSLYYNDFIDYVTIFDKYSENNIFDGTYSKLKGIPVLTSREDFDYQIVEESNNYVLDIAVSIDNELSSNSDDLVKFVNEKVENMKSIANENPDKFYIFNCHFDCYSYLSENTVNEENYEIITTKNEYENSLKNEILDILRDYSDDVELYELYYNIFLPYLTTYQDNLIYEWNSYYYDTSTSEFTLNYSNSSDVILDTID